MISCSLTPQTVSASAEPRRRAAIGLTRRGLLLFLAGALWLVPGFFIPRMVWGMAVWDILVLAAACLDASRLPAPARLRVERVWRSAPSLENAAEVEIGLEQQGVAPSL
jgi:hypothetical protein